MTKVTMGWPVWVLTPVLLLGACGKVSETVAKTAAEKMIEKQIEQGGGKAKVDLSTEGAKITSTDEKGRTTVMEMGGAKVGADEVGLPFYPGAEPIEKENQRIQTPDQRMIVAAFQSHDSADKIVAFYRDKLRAQSTGKTMMDNASPDGVSMILVDAQNDQTLTVAVTAQDGAQHITLSSAGRMPK